MKPVVVYDDKCEICTNFSNYIMKKSTSLQNTLEFLPLSEAKDKLSPDILCQHKLDKSVHLIVNEHKVLSRFEAIQGICIRTHIFPFLHKIKSPFLISILNSCYNFVSRYKDTILFRFLSRLLS